MSEMFHATNLKKINMVNLNGKLVKIKQYDSKFNHNGKINGLHQIEIITQAPTKIFDYMITFNKSKSNKYVTCVDYK